MVEVDRLLIENAYLAGIHVALAEDPEGGAPAPSSAAEPVLA